MRAFVGQPTFTKTKLTRIVPLTSSQSTLVLWPGPPATAPVPVKTKRAPDWRAGQWHLMLRDISPSPDDYRYRPELPIWFIGTVEIPHPTQ